MDDPDVTLSVEFNVDQGVGYQPAVQSEGVTGLPVGVLPVDAIFNPVRKVDYTIERTRVGQVTDYERLILEVWTDGTISPMDAVHTAAQSLVEHFFLLQNFAPDGQGSAPAPMPNMSPEIFQMPLDKLQLSPRTANCLKRAHINRVGEVIDMSDDDLLRIRNFGERSLLELKEKLAELNIPSRMGQLPAAAGDESIGGSQTATLEAISSADMDELMGSADLSASGTPVAGEELESGWSEVEEDDDGDDMDDSEEDNY